MDRAVNKMRRDKVNEEWLANALRERRESMWEAQGPENAELLKRRYEKEDQELNGTKADEGVGDGEYLAR